MFLHQKRWRRSVTSLHRRLDQQIAHLWYPLPLSNIKPLEKTPQQLFLEDLSRSKASITHQLPNEFVLHDEENGFAIRKVHFDWDAIARVTIDAGKKFFRLNHQLDHYDAGTKLPKAYRWEGNRGSDFSHYNIYTSNGILFYNIQNSSIKLIDYTE